MATQPERTAAARQAIIAAAIEVLGTEGHRALTNARLQEVSGLSRGLVGYHFGARQGLLEAVVGSIRDATSNGVDAHVISVTDAAGATYVLFAWGRPTIRAGESVEVVGIFTSTGQSAGSPVCQGVATALRRAR